MVGVAKVAPSTKLGEGVEKSALGNEHRGAALGGLDCLDGGDHDGGNLHRVILSERGGVSGYEKISKPIFQA